MTRDAVVGTRTNDDLRRGWRQQLPDIVRELQARWSLSLDPPFQTDDAGCAWIAPATRRDGTRAVLKIDLPHMESAHELHGLRFWDGDASVRLLEADDALNAMLLERCDSGRPLSTQPELDQDVVIARLLPRLWRRPVIPHPFRPLAAMISHWEAETRAAAHEWPDTGLVEAGLRLLDRLSRPSGDEVLLATDLHAGNVLSAQREPWLVIDPKPFIGDRTYDATQHLLNCQRRLLTGPETTIGRVAGLLDLDARRLGAWTFARAAAAPRDAWTDESLYLARALVSFS